MTDIRWETLLHNWIDESLTAEEQIEFDQYIHGNPSLRQHAEDMKKTVALLRSVEEHDVPEGFRLDIMNRIQASETKVLPVVTQKPTKKKFFVHQTTFAAAAAVLLVFFSLASVFPDVIPGMMRSILPEYQATSNGDDAGISGVETEPVPCERNGSEEAPRKDNVTTSDYESFEQVGFGKMKGFPRLGPNQPRLDLLHEDDSMSAHRESLVPYRWVSFKVEDLESALAAVQTLLEEPGGSIDMVEMVRVGSVPVRINITAYLPAELFTAVMQNLDATGTIYETEEMLHDNGRKIMDLKDLINQLEIDLAQTEEALNRTTDPAQKAILEQSRTDSQQILALWNRSLRLKTRGMVELSLLKAE